MKNSIFIAAVSCALFSTTHLKAQWIYDHIRNQEQQERSLTPACLCEEYDENSGITRNNRKLYENNFCVLTFVFTFNHESQLHVRIHSINQEHEELVLVGDYAGSYLSIQSGRKHKLAKQSKIDALRTIEFDGSSGCIVFPLDMFGEDNSEKTQICPVN